MPTLDEIRIAQVGVPRQPELAAALLRGRVKPTPPQPGTTPEVEILFQPGAGQFLADRGELGGLRIHHFDQNAAGYAGR